MPILFETEILATASGHSSCLTGFERTVGMGPEVFRIA
jgi:hypothetical protein